MSYNTKVYKENGGDRETFAAGGSLKIGNITFTVNAAGLVIATGIPTVDPAVTGALWNNGDVLTISSP